MAKQHDDLVSTLTLTQCEPPLWKFLAIPLITVKESETQWPQGQRLLIFILSDLGLSHRHGHCVLFLGKTLNSHSISLLMLGTESRNTSYSQWVVAFCYKNHEKPKPDGPLLRREIHNLMDKAVFLHVPQLSWQGIRGRLKNPTELDLDMPVKIERRK